MIDKNKLIDAMAEAKYNMPLHFKKPIWEDTTPETRQTFRESAEAALTALCNELPEAEQIDRFEDNSPELYSQLKELGK